jgi:hypothetical protein
MKLFVADCFNKKRPVKVVFVRDNKTLSNAFYLYRDDHLNLKQKGNSKELSLFVFYLVGATGFEPATT